jgi:hypothetical protein
MIGRSTKRTVGAREPLANPTRFRRNERYRGANFRRVAQSTTVPSASRRGGGVATDDRSRLLQICSSRGNAEKTPSTNLREGFSQPQKNAGAVGKGSKPKAATIASACPLPTSHYPLASPRQRNTSSLSSTANRVIYAVFRVITRAKSRAPPVGTNSYRACAR